MAESLILGSIAFLGYYFSSENVKNNTKRRDEVPSNLVPISNTQVDEVRAEMQKLSDYNYELSRDPYSRVIPPNYNLQPDKIQYPADFPEAEGIPFTHTNMVPHFGAKITQNLSDQAGSHKLNALNGGNAATFKPNKIEVNRMFEPTPLRENFKEVKRDENRARGNISNIQSGIRPFQPLTIAPGLGKDTDGVSADQGYHYGAFRTREETVDDLRAKGDKQKEEFLEPPARGNAFFIGKGRVRFDEIPKNKPERVFNGDLNLANPSAQVKKDNVNRNYSENVFATQRGVQILRSGPAGGKSLKTDNTKQDNNDPIFRTVKSRDVRDRVRGAKAVNKEENNPDFKGKMKVRNDNNIEREGSMNGERYRPIPSKSAQHERLRENNVSEIVHRQPADWNLEQLETNPYVDKAVSIWKD